MSRITVFLLTLFLILSAILSANLGLSYITDGHGLHPLIAFPATVLCLWLAVVLPCLQCRDRDYYDDFL